MRPIPQSLLEKIKKQKQTIYEGAEPKMSIQVSRAKTTIMDSTYWTVEIIREKEGLGDSAVSAKRLKPYGGPNRLYNIYVDNGTVRTALREYPDYQKEKWKNQFSLGSGTSVAIAFDAHWERYKGKWRPVTDGDPFLFWVDNDKKLWVQHWEDEANRFLLSENVKIVKAMRGWKNVNFAYLDEGIIACYIKTDNKVYYRNYCMQVNKPIVWEAERQITQFTNAANLEIFRTNDYRTGILCQNEQGQISWVIAERDWAGMAVPDEHITAAPSVEIIFREVQYSKGYEEESITVAPSVEILYLFASTDNELISLINVEDENENWGKLIEFEIKNEAKTLPNVVLTNVDMGQNIPVWKVEYLEGNKYLIYISEDLESGINNITGDIKADITGLYNEAGYEYIALSETFTPINLVPENIPLPEVEVIWNE